MISWHRFYDPETGRYISADPIGLKGGDVNLYSYVWQNPISNIDPWGLTAAAIYGTSTGAVGGTTSNSEANTIIARAAQRGLNKVCLYNKIYNIILISAADYIFFSNGEECDEECENSAQDKYLGKKDEKKLKKKLAKEGETIEDLKTGGKGAGGYDLYVKPNGDIVVKPKGGKGPGEPTGLNTSEL